MSFSYYKSLTLAEAQSGTVDSSDWPLAIVLDGNVQAADTDLKTTGNGGFVQNASGYDIRPYSDSALTSALTYELVFYDAANGKLEMHVKIPTLSTTTDTVIYLAFGDASLTTDGSSTSTWDSNFKGVWHLPNGSSLTANDSTSNAANATVNGATAAAGQMDGGASFDGINDEIHTTSAFTVPTTGLVSFWVKNTNTPASRSDPWLTIRHSSPTLQLFDMYPDQFGTGYFGWYNNGTDARIQYVMAQSSATWYYVVLSYTTSAAILLFNDSIVASNSGISATWDTSADTLYFGKDGVNPVFGAAVLDDVRVSSVQRVGSWQTADYNSQKASSTFITWGAKVVATSPDSPGKYIYPGIPF